MGKGVDGGICVYVCLFVVLLFVVFSCCCHVGGICAFVSSAFMLLSR